MRAFFATLAVATSLCGCVNLTTEIMPTGGSRADGTVEMSYMHGSFEKVAIDWRRADEMAGQRCVAWGYSGAERFEGSESICSWPGAYVCNQYKVTVRYQCTGEQKVTRTETP